MYTKRVDSLRAMLYNTTSPLLVDSSGIYQQRSVKGGDAA